MKDLTIKKLIDTEKKRQKKVINLIASENYVSKDVLEALGSELTNKYAEGYAGHRYYGGNEISDKVENLAKERALKLFGLSPKVWAVNVQPLSGSPANLAVYLGLVPKEGKIMGMSLDHGGHLTHGHKVSATGKFWTQVPYGVDKNTEQINYEEVKRIAMQEKPDIIVAGFTAYPRIVDFKKFREIADSVVHEDKNRKTILMVDMSHFAGLVAGGVYPTPFKYADVVTTTTHKTLRGPRSAMIFSRLNVTVPNAKGEQKNISELIDKAVFPGLQGGPHLNQIAAVAVALKEAATPSFKKYAKQIVKNADAFAKELKNLGWKIISGGTDTHLILVDVTSIPLRSDFAKATPDKQGSAGQQLTGKIASELLEKNGIIVNKNTIPNETRSPMDPSGIRLGTAAETTRGKKEKDFVAIARRIDKILRDGIDK
jgi:glycine hydroxymethyltransferase